jgi:triacylglycerol lipase
MEHAVYTKLPTKQMISCRLPQAICISTKRTFHASSRTLKPILEPRLEDHGQLIHDKYSDIRDSYGDYYSSAYIGQVLT